MYVVVCLSLSWLESDIAFISVGTNDLEIYDQYPGQPLSNVLGCLHGRFQPVEWQWAHFLLYVYVSP